MNSEFQKKLEGARPKQLKFISYAFPIISVLMFVMAKMLKVDEGSGYFINIFYGALIWNAVVGFLLVQFFAKKAGKKVEE